MQCLIPDAAHSVHLRDMIQDTGDQVTLTAIGTLALRGKGYASETTIVVVEPKTLATGVPDSTK